MKLRAWLAALAITVSTAHAGDTRPLAPLDLWKVKRVGPPSVSPDGRWCVVEVTTWDLDKDESSSNLWLLSTDGTDPETAHQQHGQEQRAEVVARRGLDRVYEQAGRRRGSADLRDLARRRRGPPRQQAGRRPQRAEMVRRLADDLLHRLDLARRTAMTPPTKRARKR